MKLGEKGPVLLQYSAGNEDNCLAPVQSTDLLRVEFPEPQHLRGRDCRCRRLRQQKAGNKGLDDMTAHQVLHSATFAERLLGKLRVQFKSSGACRIY